MTTLNITSGCDGNTADQFSEGTVIQARVCNTEAAQLIVFAEEPCHIAVTVDGEETYSSLIAPNQRYELALSQILRKQRRALASAGFRAIFGRSHLVGQTPAENHREPLPSVFTVEVRLGGPDGAIEGTYNFRMLPNEDYAQRLAGYLNQRAPEAPKPVFTRDARPPQLILNVPRCPTCNGVIDDPIAGCENAECPTNQEGGKS